MRQEAVFVSVSAANPNTDGINFICREMGDEGLALVSTAPCFGRAEDGDTTTVGLWLFFLDANAQPNPAGATAEGETYGAPYPSNVPKRWSV